MKLIAKPSGAPQTVLLHEISYEYHQHEIKQLARPTAINIMFALMLDDIESAGEMVIGVGAYLLQSLVFIDRH